MDDAARRRIEVQFVRTDSIDYIADSQNESFRKWSVPDDSVSPAEGVDYGLISRVMDHTTGRTTVTVAGFDRFGTFAAAECLADVTCLESAAKLAQGDWKKKNLQVVLKTAVIGGNSGQPDVVAAYLW